MTKLCHHSCIEFRVGAQVVPHFTPLSVGSVCGFPISFPVYTTRGNETNHSVGATQTTKLSRTVGKNPSLGTQTQEVAATEAALTDAHGVVRVWMNRKECRHMKPFSTRLRGGTQ